MPVPRSVGDRAARRGGLECPDDAERCPDCGAAVAEGEAHEVGCLGDRDPEVF